MTLFYIFSLTRKSFSSSNPSLRQRENSTNVGREIGTRREEEEASKTFFHILASNEETETVFRLTTTFNDETYESFDT
jgi:hypothetical protein